MPPIRHVFTHVFTIVLENKSYDEMFGPRSVAPCLSKQLTAQGALLMNYYASSGQVAVASGGLCYHFLPAGTVVTTPYNHYSILRTIEDIFGAGHIGFAGEPGVQSFGQDVFSSQQP